MFKWCYNTFVLLTSDVVMIHWFLFLIHMIQDFMWIWMDLPNSLSFLSVVALFGVYAMFWIKLTMFEALKWITIPGVVTFVSGHRLLSYIAERRGKSWRIGKCRNYSEFNLHLVNYYSLFLFNMRFNLKMQVLLTHWTFDIIIQTTFFFIIVNNINFLRIKPNSWRLLFIFFLLQGYIVFPRIQNFIFICRKLCRKRIQDGYILTFLFYFLFHWLPFPILPVLICRRGNGKYWKSWISVTGDAL